MPNLHITQPCIDRLKPRRRAFDIRDTKLRGFGVRVLPSGTKRYFVQSQFQGIRTWHKIGNADGLPVDEARRQATTILATIQSGGEPANPDPEQARFGDVAERLFEACQRHWKASTREVNRYYLNNQILPWFRDMRVADISDRNIRQWHASLHATPAAADRSVPVLSILLGKAETHGYRPEGSNPCTGIRRYRRRGRERFLTSEEMQRLGAVLTGHEHDRPVEIAAIRLLLLTGCRRGEVLTLKWPDYREGHLYLRDAKAGPRTVWLSTPARRILDGLPRWDAWIFPSRRKRGCLAPSSFMYFWRRLQTEAGLDDVRLHDLRHTYASVALRSGETVPTIARLLGHNDTATTLKYTHLDHKAVRLAVEALAPVLAGEA